MITAKQKKTLNDLLSLAPNPEEAFTYDGLMGYMFGLAITPDLLLPSEWLPGIFGDEGPEYASMKQAEEMMGCLMQVYNTFISAFQAGTLKFPYDFSHLKPKDYGSILDWVFGFAAALALRPEIWEPEELPHLPKEMAEDVFSSLLLIQGLTDPDTAIALFDALPEGFFEKAFPGMDVDMQGNASQLQAVLMISLPLTIDTLQQYGNWMKNRRQSRHARPIPPIPITSLKTGRNEPCPCGSGKKFKKCCDNSGAVGLDLPDLVEPGKKAKVIQGNFPQHSKNNAAPAPVYQLKVSLTGAKPPIWRRIQVPGTTTLHKLHTIIQYCMGWTDSHLHQFIVGKKTYALPDEEDNWHQHNDLDERRYSLHDLEHNLTPAFLYIYDFGDDWEHRITVEKILEPGQEQPHAVLLTGRRACPPEDIGGIYGFGSFIESMADPEDEYYDQAMEIFGEDYDPGRFDKKEIQEINDLLKKLR